MQAWVPMERLRNAEDVERWRLRAKDKYENFIESMKQQMLTSLTKRTKDLGPDHADVLALTNEIRKNSWVNVSDVELEAARKVK